MKIISSVLFLAADASYVQGDGSEAIENVVRRLGNLKKWGEDCAANLIPPAKNNVLRKIYNFDRMAIKYYNNHNADFEDMGEPEHWFDHIGVDRTISTDNPCECLWRVGRGYQNFYSRGFNEMGKPRNKAKHMWSQMTKRLEKSYGCDFSNMGYGKPTDAPTEAPTTEPPAPVKTCDAGWEKFADADTCFKTFCDDSAKPYSAANLICARQRSTMARIFTDAQNEAVAKSGPVGGMSDGVQLKGGIWIGGNDHEEGNWTFDDDTPMTYFNWAEGQPDDGNAQITQACIWMNFMKSGEWDDMNCANTRSVHCVACTKPAADQKMMRGL